MAARVGVEAASLEMPVVDLRRDFPPEAFFDLNHLFYEHGGFAPALAHELAGRGLLSSLPGSTAKSAPVSNGRARGVAGAVAPPTPRRS
jgi:hypothetical protein